MESKLEFVDKVVKLCRGGKVIYYGSYCQMYAVINKYGRWCEEILFCYSLRREYVTHKRSIFDRLLGRKGKKSVSYSGGMQGAMGVEASGILINYPEGVEYEEFMGLISRLRVRDVEEYIVADVYGRKIYKLPKHSTKAEVEDLYEQMTGRRGDEDNSSN